MNVRRYGWVVIVAFLLATGAVYLLSVPVVAVTAQTRDVIRPGMTATEAVKIIGGPPRWYDGICSFSGGVPGNPTNFYKPTWVTSSGQLVLEVDNDGVVTAAQFAPIHVCDQHLADLWLERLTRGVGASAIFAALGTLLGIIAVVLWRKGLLAAGGSSSTQDGKATGSGVWVRVGGWGISLCLWRKQAAASN